MILNEVMKETADAIREKKGTTDKIAPINFAEEIKSISTGGGDAPSGGSEYEYFALTDGWTKDLGVTFTYLSSLVKTSISGTGTIIAPISLAKLVNYNEEIDPIAVALDMSLVLSLNTGQQITIKDSILDSGTTEESLAKYRITKEQFYDLNA